MKCTTCRPACVECPPEPALPKRAAKRKQRMQESSVAIPAQDGSVFIEIFFGVYIGVYFLFWLNWSAWIYGGGLIPKAAAVLRIIAGQKTVADFGYLGAPYALGVFEGWAVNLAAAAVLACLSAAALVKIREKV